MSNYDRDRNKIKPDKQRNSVGEKVQQMQSAPFELQFNGIWKCKRGIFLLHWQHRSIKHVLIKDSSNASWWGNQLIKKNKAWCHIRMCAFLRHFLSLEWNYYAKPRRKPRNSSRRAQLKQLEARWWHCIIARK